MITKFGTCTYPERPDGKERAEQELLDFMASTLTDDAHFIRCKTHSAFSEMLDCRVTWMTAEIEHEGMK